MTDKRTEQYEVRVVFDVIADSPQAFAQAVESLQQPPDVSMTGCTIKGGCYHVYAKSVAGVKKLVKDQKRGKVTRRDA